ncbi:hypothetical protein QQX98_010679 [Neonectria punicea]|uniref:F-box domain-containing protein n=1 Tax=Neonectria punicea TaxID=979145 RepID=A0ABR1GNX4_9HYPO
MSNTFNQESGQVYKEWIVPRHLLPGQSDADAVNWSRRRPYPVFKARGVRGPRSLVDMAVNVVADNIGDVAPGHLDALPDPLLRRVWRHLEARGVCLHAWKLFSKRLLDDGDDQNLGLYRFRQHICRPSDELTRYTQPLTSPSADFITHLVITGGCAFLTHDLLCLADMSNLGILELIQPADEMRSIFPHVSDRLVRGWTEKDDPFPLLRILRIWGDESTSQESLHWVSKFPSLALYDVTGAHADWQSPDAIALKEGWNRADSHSGLEDSLLRYLMLFAPLEETRINRLRDLSKSIDADLVSLCSDSRCAVKFVADGQAPPLLDYLTDNAKVRYPSWDRDAAAREAHACHGVAFEPWAFWLYAFIGQLSGDRDLAGRGVRPDTQAVAGPFVLPSKPVACLHLGHIARGGISAKPSYVSRGLFATRRHTFTREAVVRGTKMPKPEPIPKTEASLVVSERTAPVLALRRKKRKRLDDMLQSFTG